MFFLDNQVRKVGVGAGVIGKRVLAFGGVD